MLGPPSYSPHVAKAARGKFDSRSQAKFWVTWELRVSFAIMKEVFGRK